MRNLGVHRADALSDGTGGGEVEGGPLHGRQLAVGNLVHVCWSHIQPAEHHTYVISEVNLAQIHLTDAFALRALQDSILSPLVNIPYLSGTDAAHHMVAMNHSLGKFQQRAASILLVLH